MNRDMLVKAFIFTAGAAIGSVVTWKVIKTKYEQISKEEIESVREEYQRLTKIMRMEIDACRKATAAHTKVDNAVDEDDDDADVDYPDDDDRDFTEKEKEQVEYYKITSRYRGSYEENNENNEEGEEDGSACSSLQRKHSMESSSRALPSCSSLLSYGISRIHS